MIAWLGVEDSKKPSVSGREELGFLGMYVPCISDGHFEEWIEHNPSQGRGKGGAAARQFQMSPQERPGPMQPAKYFHQRSKI